MLQTRHWAILSYAGLAGMAIFKGIVNDTNELVVVLTPLGGMFIWDKIQSSKTPSK